MTDLPTLLATHFIARRDVKARQLLTGEYNPDKSHWQMANLSDHLAGRATYGHYLVSQENQTKLFAFDIDLEVSGSWIQQADLSQLPEDWHSGPEADHWFAHNSYVHEFAPREDWKNRAHPGRPWLKQQMRELVEKFTCAVRDHLGIPTVAAYSGNKGVHVYGLTGLIPAAEAREAAKLVMATVGGGRFQIHKGNNFYKDTSVDWHDSYHNFSIEIFPKQDTVKEGGYGNLMRLPLGVNLKNPSDPTFILDQSTAHNTITPASPELAARILASGNPWSA
ncbi:hypothetical protein Mbo2_119 [Rhodococcus phage Mbo2]|uniref:TOTE conflict system primase domain-containing protein n=1 Tax=Rhodococcus phage Mbo2 TaxID=2936911 RepID=A0A9E7IEK9_9CAUD|nr:hypothetical protein Mbo2_119 [Rhodococcus phage Mbo2]